MIEHLKFLSVASNPAHCQVTKSVQNRQKDFQRLFFWHLPTLFSEARLRFVMEEW